MTRDELVTEIAQRLGDSAHGIWTAAELETYVQEGYDTLTMDTGCLFAQAALPDYFAGFTYTSDFEAAHFTSGQYVIGPATFTSTFERDFADNSPGPANHSYPWE